MQLDESSVTKTTDYCARTLSRRSSGDRFEQEDAQFSWIAGRELMMLSMLFLQRNAVRIGVTQSMFVCLDKRYGDLASHRGSSHLAHRLGWTTDAGCPPLDAQHGVDHCSWILLHTSHLCWPWSRFSGGVTPELWLMRGTYPTIVAPCGWRMDKVSGPGLLPLMWAGSRQCSHARLDSLRPFHNISQISWTGMQEIQPK